jgi:hypothetical protein
MAFASSGGFSRTAAAGTRDPPIGYGALIEAYDLSLPLPPRLAGVAERHHPVDTADWRC